MRESGLYCYATVLLRDGRVLIKLSRNGITLIGMTFCIGMSSCIAMSSWIEMASRVGVCDFLNRRARIFAVTYFGLHVML